MRMACGSIVFVLLGTVLLAARIVLIPAVAQASVVAKVEAEKLFAFKVLPLFKDRCFGCHGDDPKKLRGGFDMRTLQAILRGGDSEKPALIAGKPDASPLYKVVRWNGLKMPPKATDRLSEPQVELIRQWIAAGAPWPDDKTLAKYQKQGWTKPVNKDGVLVKTSGGLADVWTNRRHAPADLWAFQPVRKMEAPARGTRPIDAFVNQRQQAAGVTAAPEADRLTFIRRATYDLTGSPPSIPPALAAFGPRPRIRHAATKGSEDAAAAA